MHMSENDGLIPQKQETGQEAAAPAGTMTRGQRIVHYWLPCKGDSGKEKARKVFLILAIIVFITSAVAVGFKYYKTYENAKKNSDLNAMIEKSAGLTWDDIYRMYPDIDFPEGMQLKYALAYAQNQDLVGWLSIEGTSLQVPIVKGADNSFYLHHDFYKKYTDYGNPFMDYENNIKPLDYNMVIYGHNMRDKQQFGQLSDLYDTLEHASQYPVIQFNTIFQDYQWAVVGVMLTNGMPAQDNGYLFPFNATTMGEFSRVRFVKELQARFLYDTGVYFDDLDQLLTLTTCSYAFTEARLVVVAKLLKEGEAVPAPGSMQGTINPNPRYPQVWYNKHRQTNPFSYDNWHPNNI